MDPTRKLLIVEDNPGDVRLIVEMLHDSGGNMTVESVETQAAAIDRLAVGDVDVMLLDLGLPDSQGLETFTRLRNAAPGVAIIVLTGDSDVELAVRAVGQGAQDFLVKDRVGGEQLARSIAYALARKRAEREHSHMEGLFRATFEQAAVGIAHVGADGAWLRVNQCLCDMLGYTREELLRTTVAAITHPDDVDTTVGRLRQLGAGDQENYDVDKRYLRKDGSPVWVRLVVALVRDEEGAPDYQVSVITDISERKQAEQERLRAEKFFRDTFEHADVGIVHVNSTDGTYLRVNPRLCDMLGYTREELLATTFATVTHPDDVKENVAAFQRMLAGEQSGYVADTRYLRKDGSIVWVHLNVVSIRKEDGTPDYNLTVITDITERKQAEKALASSESRLRAMFDYAPSGIVLIDSLTGRICEANPTVAKILGRTIEELCEVDWMSFTHPDDLQASRDNMALMNAGETNGFQMDKRYLRPDGTTVWADTTVASILVEDEAHPQGVAMIEDITADKAAEELATRQAERIERTLTSVIDIAGAIGELRDPYTAGHQRRVAELAARMAQELGMSDLEVADIRVAGLLHDIGKAAVPTELLGKPGLISPVEFDLIKGHVEAGYRIAVSANLEEPIPELIYQHHERCDGSGYPRGLVGDQILSGAKVLAVADVVEAMMSHRPYRPALGIDVALAEIERGAGSLYDAEVSKACVALFREGGFEFSA